MVGQPPLRIGLIASPVIALPPAGYAGTERIVTALALGLHRLGHTVTVFTSGDSELPCEIVPVTPSAVWATGRRGSMAPYDAMSVMHAWEERSRFDVLHSHVEATGFALARLSQTPVLSTMHSRLDVSGTAELIDSFPDIPLVAISDSQRRWNPEANWLATIHHGLDFSDTPFRSHAGDYLALVGRISPEKGVAEAIEVARRTGLPLAIAAKVHESDEARLFESLVQPAIDEGIVRWMGELGTEERDRLMAGALATLMLGAWPEPFGLVAIESMATGTPVIARRAGGCTETVIHGDTGYLVDDVDEAAFAVSRLERLDRTRIGSYARGRFSADRMVSLYERLYYDLVSGAARPTVRTSAGSRTEVPSVPPTLEPSPVGTGAQEGAADVRADVR